MELKPGVGSKMVSSCSGPLNKSPAISGFLHPRLSREAWKHSQTSATAEGRTFPGATPSRPHLVPPVPRGPRGWETRGAAVVLGLGSAVREDLGSALRAGDGAGDRHGSSTAVSSEVKVRARRARRVHPNTHTPARSPLRTHSPSPWEARSPVTSPLGPTRTHPSAPATDHEAPRLPDAWTSARDEGWPSPARGGLPRGDTQPRRAIPAASRESPPGVRPELNLSVAASPPSRVSRLGVSLQASPRPPGPMTAAAAQRQADYNKKQSFPLGPPTPAPLRLFPPPPPPLQCYAKRAGTGAPAPGTKPAFGSRARFRRAAPLLARACARIRGLILCSAASPFSRLPAAWCPEKKP